MDTPLLELKSSKTLEQIKALASDLRYRMVCLLAQREWCVCELEVMLELNQSKVSYHLGILKDAGLVCSEQRGKNSFYQLERSALYLLGGNLLQEVLSKSPDLELTYPTDSIC
jgi:ArsR family transcriptional regulator, arsenate/arsenite/antimonite-responsive transcriptional repressor